MALMWFCCYSYCSTWTNQSLISAISSTIQCRTDLCLGYTRVMTLQLLKFTVNVCCLIINISSFIYTCCLDSSLEVSEKFLYFSYKYNLTFSGFCKYQIFKIENREVFIFFEFIDERKIFTVS